MREGGLRQSVMLCGRGLRTTQMHHTITTYFLVANIEAFSISSKYFGTVLKKIPENELLSIYFIIFADELQSMIN
jgi:hypothetical protein